jgi:hypothetical protein
MHRNFIHAVLFLVHLLPRANEKSSKRTFGLRAEIAKPDSLFSVLYLSTQKTSSQEAGRRQLKRPSCLGVPRWLEIKLSRWFSCSVRVVGKFDAHAPILFKIIS